jgi:hypothetical protein
MPNMAWNHEEIWPAHVGNHVLEEGFGGMHRLRVQASVSRFVILGTRLEFLINAPNPSNIVRVIITLDSDAETYAMELQTKDAVFLKDDGIGSVYSLAPMLHRYTLLPISRRD